MAKAQLSQQPSGKWTVRDSKSGRFLEVRGADSMKGSKLTLKKGVDLTKPIAKQAFKSGGPSKNSAPRGGAVKSHGRTKA